MFDISWSEFLLIGVVALIVIGPKELPAVMRTMGQWTRKVRSMAADFQNQFQEAMREAEMTDLKKQVDDMAQDVTNFDPLKDVREDVASVGENVKRSLAVPEPAAPADAEPEPAPAQVPAETLAAPSETLAAAESPAPAPPQAPSEQSAREMETIGAGRQTTAPESDEAAQPGGTGRTE